MVKILIIKLGAIGDVLRTTSLLPGLKEKSPEARIDWLTSKISKELLENNPYIANVMTWEEREQLGSYSLVINLEDDHDACALASRIESEQLIGAFEKGGKVTYTPSGWFDMSVISQYGIEKANQLKASNRKTYQQHMADLLGIKVSPYVFSLNHDEMEYGERTVKSLGFSKKERIVGINTGAGSRWPLKSWGVEQTIELVGRLKDEAGLPSLILGGEQEQERNQIIAKETGMPNAGTHTLRHFAAIVDQCRLLLSSDSLAMHFAIALKKRLVVFFGPTSAAEIELYGLGEKLTPAVPCLTCYKKSCQIDPSCMDSLSVDEVFSAMKRQLGRVR